MGSTAVVLVGALTMALMSSCLAYDFYVGGRDGWVERPRESYDSWAGRNRFQINDTLIFKYKQGNDSVLVVTEPAYNSCNVTDPIQSYTDGDTVLQFNRSGPFYFISGAAGHCAQGQRLIVVVLAVRNHTSPSPPAPAPSSPYDAQPPAPSPSPFPAFVPPSPPSSPASNLAASRASLGVMMVLLMALGRAFS